MSGAYERESSIALRAVVEAGQIFNRTNGDLDVKTKGSRRDLVTGFDRLAEDKIRALLTQTGIPILGEESFTGEKFDPNAPNLWVVDPLDGTTNFVHGLPLYCIAVGLLADGRVRAGALKMPALNEVYCTFGQHGSYLNGSQLTVRPAALSDSLSVASFSGYTRLDDPKVRDRKSRLYGLFNDIDERSRGCLRLGSAAMNICWAAAGRIQVAYGIENLLWDVVAASAVARLAGCKAYIHLEPDSARVSYVIGAPGAAEEVRDLLEGAGLAEFRDKNGEGDIR